jgi:hypothetical protein
VRYRRNAMGDLIPGVQLPNLTTALQAAGTAETNLLAQSVVGSQAAQQAASQAAAAQAGQSVLAYVQANPIMAGAIALGVLAAIRYL